MQMNGAQILIETLISEGVETIFGYPGGSVLNIYDELYKSSDRIQHVLSAHEQGAAHAADGYARASGKTGVVFATSGPGATNLVTGIANAYLDSVPVVAFTGNVPTGLLGRDSFQEVDIIGITQPVVKHSFLVREVEDLEPTIREAFRIANAGRKGPVLIDVPKNIQAAMAEYLGQQPRSAVGQITMPSAKSVALSPAKPLDPAELEEALSAIQSCERPFIYCGGGVLAAHAEAEILELSHRLTAPIGLSLMGLTAVPHSYPLNLGMCGMHGRYAATVAQSEADLLVAVGVRFSDRATGNIDEYRKKCKIIHIDIDLAEIGKNVAATIGLCGGVKEVLSALLAKLPLLPHEQWMAHIDQLKQEEMRKIPFRTGFTPQNIIRSVHAALGDDTVVATDVGQHQMWVAQSYPFEKPHTLLTSGGLGAMGYGLGAAIGGCMAKNCKRTVLFTSDGSFGMNLNEMATAVSQKLPLVIVLLNNGVLGMVRQWQGRFYERRFSQTTLDRKTDFSLLAQAFGAAGSQAACLEELMEILSQKLPSDTPYLIDCKIDVNEEVLPMIPPGGAVSDIMVD
ncbi:MAG: biosynthetic-type acetolactate synthase large subunit [Actinomycetia bacterium]|nr:biosynthetic-type acetolactate synthase large subunit [Actinomycetes bacterium]